MSLRLAVDCDNEMNLLCGQAQLLQMVRTGSDTARLWGDGTCQQGEPLAGGQRAEALPPHRGRDQGGERKGWVLKNSELVS